jgi:hypothetical protein
MFAVFVFEGDRHPNFVIDEAEAPSQKGCAEAQSFYFEYHNLNAEKEGVLIKASRLEYIHYVSALDSFVDEQMCTQVFVHV